MGTQVITVPSGQYYEIALHVVKTGGAVHQKGTYFAKITDNLLDDHYRADLTDGDWHELPQGEYTVTWPDRAGYIVSVLEKAVDLAGNGTGTGTGQAPDTITVPCGEVTPDCEGFLPALVTLASQDLQTAGIYSFDWTPGSDPVMTAVEMETTTGYFMFRDGVTYAPSVCKVFAMGTELGDINDFQNTYYTFDVEATLPDFTATYGIDNALGNFTDTGTGEDVIRYAGGSYNPATGTSYFNWLEINNGSGNYVQDKSIYEIDPVNYTVTKIVEPATLPNIDEVRPNLAFTNAGELIVEVDDTGDLFYRKYSDVTLSTQIASSHFSAPVGSSNTAYFILRDKVVNYTNLLHANDPDSLGNWGTFTGEVLISPITNGSAFYVYAATDDGAITSLQYLGEIDISNGWYVGGNMSDAEGETVGPVAQPSTHTESLLVKDCNSDSLLAESVNHSTLLQQALDRTLGVNSVALPSTCAYIDGQTFPTKVTPVVNIDIESGDYSDTIYLNRLGQVINVSSIAPANESSCSLLAVNKTVEVETGGSISAQGVNFIEGDDLGAEPTMVSAFNDPSGFFGYDYDGTLQGLVTNPNAGTYTVTYTIQDSTGAESTATLTINAIFTGV